MDPFLGQVLLFAGNFAPRGWALCEGQLLPINQNQALFSILGTTYGGDGRTTFALPDLRGRAPLSQGNGAGLPPSTLGQRAGSATTTLSVANLPQAQISIPAFDDEATVLEPTSASVMAVPNDDKKLYADSGTNNLKPGSIAGASNVAFSNEPPYLALNYIVAMVGTFPSRN